MRYDTETVTYLGLKFWSIIPNEIKESVQLETFRQKIIHGNQIIVHVAIAKSILQMLVSLILSEFQPIYSIIVFIYLHLYLLLFL